MIPIESKCRGRGEPMNRCVAHGVAWALAMAGLSGASALAQATKYEKPPAYHLGADERKNLEEKTDELEQAVARLTRAEPARREALADVAVYAKAGTWALKFDEFYNAKDVAMTLDVLKHGLERARALADGRRPWAEARGTSIRGYESKVDGSFQPYALIVPEGIDPANNRVRLDVVLHGRGATLNEARFIASHEGKPAPADAAGKIVLHVFGRTNNAYRWAGEADVFEAIDAVKRDYKIDDRRVVLRGFSMGGAGAWHLGLHHPSVWSSVEAGAGFSETKNYAKLDHVPEYQEKALHIYDAVDAAANAFNVPIAGYGGEDDPQRQASVNIEEALKTLGYEMKPDGLITRGVGIDFLRVVGAGMGHKVDPASTRILDAFHDEHAVVGVNLNPKRVKFVTYTLKNNQGPWLAVEAMQEHYRRAYVDAEVVDKTVVVHAIENVAVLSVFRQMGATIKLGDQEFPLETAVRGLLPDVYFRLVGDRWQLLEYNESRAFEENDERGKRHNLQGPIDDAFGAPFLCVVGTGTAWNRQVHEWSERRLKGFADDWRRFLRGEVRIKKDTELTPDDIDGHHLVLFGDPGSNTILARLLKDLPLRWTETELTLGGQTYPAGDHVPVLITANPLNPLRYVVLNSGHTFGAREFRGTNALLFPRLGDYAVFETGSKPVEPIVSGYFDERWKDASADKPGR
jgi:dienelactone hydrolase